MPTDLVDAVDSWDRKLRVDPDREELRNGPEFTPSNPVNREFEARVCDHYGHPKYWLSG